LARISSRTPSSGPTTWRSRSRSWEEEEEKDDGEEDGRIETLENFKLLISTVACIFLSAHLLGEGGRGVGCGNFVAYVDGHGPRNSTELRKYGILVPCILGFLLNS
jgi:hypothetical protein